MAQMVVASVPYPGASGVYTAHYLEGCPRPAVQRLKGLLGLNNVFWMQIRSIIYFFVRGEKTTAWGTAADI